MTHKITQIQPGEQWTGRDGQTNYDSTITLDDGRSATVTAKKPDRWQIGDEVTIKSERPGRYGLKWSLEKAGYGNGNYQQAPKQKNDIPQIEAAWAINAAVLWHTQNQNSEANAQSITEKARELLTLKYELAKEIEQKDQPQTNENAH